MGLRRRSVRLRIALLVVVPLLFLVSFFAYSVSTSAAQVLTLNRSRAMMEELSPPITSLQRAISRERAQAIVYYAQPTPGGLAGLERLQAATDRAETTLRTAARSAPVLAGASAAGQKAIATLLADLTRLPALRAEVPTRSIGERRLFAAYNGLIAASYQALEQATLAEGDLSQVLPGIAVVELAISDEYVQQESALINGDFAAGRLPAGDHQAFVGLVGAHRLLYAQSLQYLSRADRGDLQRDLSPRTASELTSLENALAARVSPRRAPPVRPAAWNAAVAAYSAQIERAVGQSQARLAAAARAQADLKLRALYLTAGLGLAAVALSLVVSLWLAANLTRQLAGLRDTALRLADVHLPDVVSRLRAGQNVDVAAEVPPLAAGPDEIGQVKAAFNTAQRTAIEAAVDEAKVRRAVNDVFRSLARRSQSLLHRQMALLDALERRENDPDILQSLYRIDHLTTRMRRHAESLIVLAGESPKRAWRKPVPFVDVLRAAAAEVEDYTRIKVTTTTKAALAGPAVADVIHLVAELAENATLFSPQNTAVLMTGELVGNGFVVEIQDRGLGLSAQEVAALNARLADPPAFDLSGSDQLGVFVAARLAKRHGIRVSLSRSPYGGVTAIALIPQSLVVAPGSADVDGAPAPAAPPDGYPPPDPGPPRPPTPASPSPRPAGPARPPRPAGPAPTPHPSGHRLPQRVRQASLAPQLRTPRPAPPGGGAPPGLRDPETARTVMSAFQRGWRRGLDEQAPASDPPIWLARETGEDR